MAIKRGDDPKKKKKSSVKIENNKAGIDQAKVENIFYADIKDPVARKKAAQKYENEAYNKSLKSGYVSLSSLDPTSRKLWSNAIGKSSGVYGDILDYSVSGPAKSYEDIYGKGSKFNPEEFESASKSGNLDKYMSKHPELSQSGIPRAKYGGMRYRTEEDDKKENEFIKGKLRSELGDPAKVKISTMEFKKPVGISTKTRGQLSISERPDDEKWTAPSKGLVSVEEKFYTRGGKEKTNKAISKVVENVKRRVQYGQELKQGKAYFGRFEGMSAGDISETKKEIKQQIKDVRKGTALQVESISKRERIGGFKNELKQSKQAGKYIKNLGAQYTASGARAGESSKRMTSSGDVVDEGTGRIRFATPESFKNYRKSDDNATNRNRTFGRKK
jgi:hypothetical protein